MSYRQFVILHLLLSFIDVPQKVATLALTIYYRLYPSQAPRINVERKRHLAYLLLVFYLLGIVYTIHDTYITLPGNLYNKLNTTCCHNLDLEQLKGPFITESLIYSQAKTAEALRDFVDAAAAYNILMDDKAREIYDRFGPVALLGYPEHTLSNFNIAWVKMMATDHAISL
jgi:hypothetical protein